MAELLTVGEFSRLTRLTVKALRHYHEEDVLRPAQVDPATGYRYYSLDQVTDAQLVRRLRRVRMPLAEVRAVLAETNPDARRAGIGAHLDRLHRELIETAAAVASLQALLAQDPSSVAISYRVAPAQRYLALSAQVELDEIATWSGQAYPRLYAACAAAGTHPTGPAGALYGEGWAQQGGGEITAVLPVPVTSASTTDGIRLIALPAQPLAVVVHVGPFSEIDRSYAVLGTHVVTRGLAAAGPIREFYLTDPATEADPDRLRPEVCWPITHRPEED